jgi:zinc D-Ala-D-Ala carboxypeptidase
MALFQSVEAFQTAHQSDPWHWPHFAATELSCHCGRFCKGEYFHDPNFLDALETLRAACGPLIINSAHRCRTHNRRVGGVSNSLHLTKIAVDIALAGHDRAQLIRAAQQAGFSGFGLGRTFLHLDRGPKRCWTYPGALGGWIKALGFNPLRTFPSFKPPRPAQPNPARALKVKAQSKQ